MYFTKKKVSIPFINISTVTVEYKKVNILQERGVILSGWQKEGKTCFKRGVTDHKISEGDKKKGDQEWGGISG